MPFVSLGDRLTGTVNNYYDLKSTFVIEGSSEKIKKTTFFFIQAHGLLKSIPGPRQRTLLWQGLGINTLTPFILLR